MKIIFVFTANGFPRCKSGDNQCIPAVINEVIRKVKDGNAELNVPPFEPLFIPQVNIISGKQSSVAIELYFKDCNFYGISNAIINKTV
jgi:Haemolymph juvenile hormone binding protein (JHBP)